MNIAHEPNPYEDIAPPYKIISVGDSDVGKTTLIQRMVKNEFCEDIESTVGAGSFTMQYYYDTQNFQFDFFDTAGQEKYKSITKFYLKGAAVSLICFDPLKPNWAESISKWYNLVISEEPETEFIIIGTKHDLWRETLKIKSIMSEVHRRCNIEEIVFVSSLTGENIDNLLNLIAQKSEHYSSNNKSITEPIQLKNQRNNRFCSCF